MKNLSSQKPFLMISTTANRREAEVIAEKLLRGKLAACVNVVYPAKSLFWWKGKLEKAREAILLIKTTRSKIKPIERKIQKLHSYENPEIIALEIKAGSKSYLNWVRNSVR